MPKLPEDERIAAIRKVLVDRAHNGHFITYDELGRAVGMSARGPWKKLLDSISTTETQHGNPDLTYLVINRKTRLPSQIEFVGAKPASDKQVSAARKVVRCVFDKYCPTAEVPF